MTNIRIICPQCLSEYEVDETLVPKEGREVKCSECNNTWHALPLSIVPAGISEAAQQTENATEMRDSNLRDLFKGVAPLEKSSIETEMSDAVEALSEKALAAKSRASSKSEDTLEAEVESLTDSEGKSKGKSIIVDDPIIAEEKSEPSADDTAPEASDLDQEKSVESDFDDLNLSTPTDDTADGTDAEINETEINTITNFYGRGETSTLTGKSGKDVGYLEDAENNTDTPSGKQTEMAATASDSQIDAEDEKPVIQKKRGSGFWNGFLLVILLILLLALLRYFAQPIANQFPSLAEPISYFANGFDNALGALSELIQELRKKLQL